MSLITDSPTPQPATVESVTTDPETIAAVGELEQSMVRVFGAMRARVKVRAELVSPGLQPAAYQALSCIISSKRIQPGALAETLSTDKSTVSRLLRQLEDRELIVRVTDDEDRRISHILPTQAAAQRVTDVRSAEHERLYKGLIEWDLDDIHAFTRLLLKLEKLGR